MIEIGKLDRVTTIVGERGTGKSTFLKQDIREFQRETGGYAIVHSPHGQIGSEPDILFSESLNRLSDNLYDYPEKIQCVTTGDPEDLFSYVDALSLAVRKEAFRKADVPFNPNVPPPKPIKATPILLAIDEGAYMTKDSKNSESRQELERLLTSARHRHLAFTWSIQAPTARAWVLLEQSNRLRIFRYVHQYGGTALNAAGIPMDIIDKIKTLPRFVYYRYDKIGEQKNRFAYLDKPTR